MQRAADDRGYAPESVSVDAVKKLMLTVASSDGGNCD